MLYSLFPFCFLLMFLFPQSSSVRFNLPFSPPLLTLSLSICQCIVLSQFLPSVSIFVSSSLTLIFLPCVTFLIKFGLLEGYSFDVRRVILFILYFWTIICNVIYVMLGNEALKKLPSSLSNWCRLNYKILCTCTPEAYNFKTEEKKTPQQFPASQNYQEDHVNCSLQNNVRYSLFQPCHNHVSGWYYLCFPILLIIYI